MPETPPMREEMKLGISSYTYTWSVGVPGSEPPRTWDEKRLILQAAELEVDCLQIADNLPLHSLEDKQLRDLKKMAAKAGIGLEVGARGMTPDHLDRYIQIAHMLDASLLRFVIDGQGFTPRPQEVIWNIKGALPELESKGIKLAIENHDRLKASEFLSIIEGVGSDQVGICLDSVNSMGAGEGIETVTSLLAPFTFNLHIKEFLVQRHPHMMGFTIEGRPVGDGQLPLGWMLEQLGPDCQSAILELWTPPEKDIKDTLAKEQEWALQSIEYLKTNFFNKKHRT
jgi:sugar phosphate isomerase/epimerase